MSEIDQKQYTVWSPARTSRGASAYLILLKILDVSFPNFCVLDPHSGRALYSKVMEQ